MIGGEGISYFWFGSFFEENGAGHFINDNLISRLESTVDNHSLQAANFYMYRCDVKMSSSTFFCTDLHIYIQ